MRHPTGQKLTEDQLGTFEGSIQNAELALAAVGAIVSHSRYKADTKLQRLVEACKASLERLSQILEKGQTDEVMRAVKEVRKRFIELATHESQSIGS